MISREPKTSSFDIRLNMKPSIGRTNVRKERELSQGNGADEADDLKAYELWLDEKLRSVFKPVLDEPVPPKLKDLLNRLREKSNNDNDKKK